jgi:hypothetical protein
MLLVFPFLPQGRLTEGGFALFLFGGFSAAPRRAGAGFQPMKGSSYVRMFGMGVKSGHILAAAFFDADVSALQIVFCACRAMRCCGAAGSGLPSSMQKKLGGIWEI